MSGLNKIIDESWNSKMVDLKPTQYFSISDFLAETHWKEGILGDLFASEDTKLGRETIENVGIEISRTEYREGYGFLRFHSPHLGEYSLVSLRYDTSTQEVTQISARSYSALEVKGSLFPLLDDQYGLIETIFDGLGLSTSISEGDRQLSDQAVSKRLILQKRLNELNPLDEIELSEKFYFNRNDKLVAQGEYSVGVYGEESSLRTYGVGPCVALFLYDGESKSGAVFHVDPRGENSQLIKSPIGNAIFDMERHGAKRRNIKARLIGGNDLNISKHTILSIYDALPPEVEITQQKILLTKNVYNLLLDLENGEIYTYQPLDDNSPSQRVALLQSAIDGYKNDPLRRV